MKFQLSCVTSIGFKFQGIVTCLWICKKLHGRQCVYFTLQAVAILGEAVVGASITEDGADNGDILHGLRLRFRGERLCREKSHTKEHGESYGVHGDGN